MDWIDWVIVILISATAVFGYLKGFVHEVISLIAWIAAFIAAKLYAVQVYQILGQWIENNETRWILAFLIPFLLVLLIAAVIKFILRNLLENTGLGGFNHTMGAVFGLFKGLLIITVIVLVLRLTLFNDAAPIREQSRLLPYFDRFVVLLADPISDYVQPKIEQLRTQVQQLDEGGEAPDPIELLNNLGWDDTAMKYIREHPHELDSILEELKDNPNWKSRWEQQITRWKKAMESGN